MQPLPRWSRIVLVVAAFISAAGLGLVSYRYLTRPITLTVAAGSIDGDAPRLMSAIAERLSSANSHVRLKVISKDSVIEATKAFLAGETDLAVIRSDIGDVSSARTLLRIGSGIVLVIAAPGSTIGALAELKGKTVGVVGGEVNQRLTDTFKELGADVQFKDLAVDGIAPAFKAKQIQALVVVIPISEKYLAMVRNITQPSAKQKARLLPIDSAEAIANVARYYESYELPKGTLRGVPDLAMVLWLAGADCVAAGFCRPEPELTPVTLSASAAAVKQAMVNVTPTISNNHLRMA